MGAHVPTVVVVVVPVGPVVVVVVATVVVVAATVVVVVLPSGSGSVGIVSVGIGNWAICTRVSATGCAWPGRPPRTAKVASAAARRRTRAKRRRRSDLLMRLLAAGRSGTSATGEVTIRPRRSAPQYPRPAPLLLGATGHRGAGAGHSRHDDRWLVGRDGDEADVPDRGVRT